MSSAESVVHVPSLGVPLGAYSPAVVAQDLIFTAGQVGERPDGGRPEEFAEEAALALANLSATLEAGGSSLQGLVRVQCILADISTFAVFDRVYRETVPEPFPARFTFEARLVDGLRIELIAVAETHAS